MQRIRLALLVLALGGACAFLVPVRDGRPALSFDGARARAAGLASGFRASGRGGPAPDGGMRRVYKWKDQHGVVHYSNRKPADHPEARQVRLPISWVQAGGDASPPKSEGAGRARPKESVDPELEKLMNEANQ